MKILFKKLPFIFVFLIAAGCVHAAPLQNAILKKGSVFCFASKDWKGVLMEFQDGNPSGLNEYLKAGKCRVADVDLKVGKVGDGPWGGDMMILLPSGRSAYTAKNFLR